MILESIAVANDLILSYATPSRDGQELATLLEFLNLIVTNRTTLRCSIYI